VNGLYIVGCERATGKSAIALGVQELMGRRFGRLGVFRPVVAADAPDAVLSLLRSRGAADAPEEASIGVTYEDVHSDQEGAIAEIVVRYRALARGCDAVLVVGTDFTDVGASGELAFNARVAANLGVPALCVVSGARRSEDEVMAAIELALESLRDADCDGEAIFANRIEPELVAEISGRLGRHEPPVYVLPEVGLLTAPTVADLQRACSGELIGGDASALGLEASAFVVASMTLPNLLDSLSEGAIVITGGDRADIVLGVLMAHASGTLPALSGLILTGGLRPAAQVLRLIDGLHTTLPIVLTKHGTYTTAHLAGTTVGRITPETTRKIDTALKLFDEHVDRSQLLDRIATAHPEVLTPLMFEYELLDRARADRAHIVLPEGTEDRVLRAADTLLRRAVVEVTLLGDPAVVRARHTAAARHYGGRRDRPGHRRAARAVRGGIRRQARRQGRDRRRGSRCCRRRLLLRHPDGRARARGRDGLGCGAHDGGDDPPRVRARQGSAGRLSRLERVLHVPARPCARVWRLRGEPGPDCRATG
jgi:phosphate acetyltransferase